jgi:hypothetical protein
MSPDIFIKKMESPAFSEALKTTSTDAIINYERKNWESCVRVLQSAPGELLTVDDDWHGAGKQGEVEVLFGDALLKPISGTRLPPEIFTSWLDTHGFEIRYRENTVTADEGADYLKSDKFAKDGLPVFEAIRREGGPPVVIQVFNGSCSYPMQRLTEIGNDEQRTLLHHNIYRGIVMELMEPFIAKGTTNLRKLAHFPDDLTKITPIDDCLAGCTTIAGDIEFRHQMNQLENVFYDMKFSVLTTQGLSIALFLSEKYHLPMIIRGGAASFGLAGADLGTNYMLNTQKDMIYYNAGKKDECIRKYTSGDFGNIMSDGSEADVMPYKKLHGNGTPYQNTIFYLKGGWPIRQIWEAMYAHRKKPIHGHEYVVIASRIDNSPISGKPTDWGVIFKGIRKPVEL